MFRKLTSLRILSIAAVAGSMSVAGCAKKSEAELAEAERVGIREQKRQDAIKVYKELADKFPEHPKASEAGAKVQALTAAAPKK